MSFDRTTTTTTTITPQPPSNCCSVILAWLDWPPLALLIFFGLSQINIITTITQKQCVDVAPRALMQMSQTILHSPITFQSLSLLWSNLCPLSVIDSTCLSHLFGMGATSPILTRVCMLACTVPIPTIVHIHILATTNPTILTSLGHHLCHITKDIHTLSSHWNQHAYFFFIRPHGIASAMSPIALARLHALIFQSYQNSHSLIQVHMHTSDVCVPHYWLCLFVAFTLRLVCSLNAAASISHFDVTCLKDWGT